MNNIRHKWTWKGKKWAFCIKCGADKVIGKRIKCNKSDKQFESHYPHQFRRNTNNTVCCQKCGIRRSQVIIRYTTFKHFKQIYCFWEPKPYRRINGKKRYYPSIFIPCIESHDEYVVRDIIE